MCKGLGAWCVGLTEGRVCCERGGWGIGETEKGKPTPTGSSKPVRNLDFSLEGDGEPLKGIERFWWGQGTPIMGPSFVPLLWPLRPGPTCPWPVLVGLSVWCPSGGGAGEQPGLWECPPFHSYPRVFSSQLLRNTSECSFPGLFLELLWSRPFLINQITH